MSEKVKSIVTIKEVAELAGVSVATVSRVLNKNGYVKAQTSAKVQNAIDKLNYTPNSVARTLFTKKSNTIGLLIPDITNPFFSELFKSVEKYAEAHGKLIFLFNSDYEIDRERKFLQLVTSRLIDSAIIVSDTLTEKDFDNIDIPIVTVDRKISNNISSLSINNYQGAKEAVKYLVGRNCQYIAHITGPKDNQTSIERKTGFLDEAKRQNIDNITVTGTYDIKESVNVSRILLEKHPNIDGIFAGNDIIAVGLIKGLNKMAYQKPLSIIGFDGIRLGEEITPEITTLSQPIDEIASKAIEILINNKKKTHYSFDVNLVIRET